MSEPTIDTLAPWNVELRGVVHHTDRPRIWIEDPEGDETSRALWVPAELALLVDVKRLRMFYDLTAAMAWAHTHHGARLNLALLYD